MSLKLKWATNVNENMDSLLTAIIGKIRSKKDHDMSEHASEKAFKLRWSRNKRQHSCLTLFGWLKLLR